jgi:phage RecT family recombinase
MRRYTLRTLYPSAMSSSRPPTAADMLEAARRLRALDDSDAPAKVVALIRAHAVGLTIPRWWRERNRKTSPLWPPHNSIETWVALGASRALDRKPPQALVPAYAAGYVPTLTAYNHENIMHPQHNQSRDLTNAERREIAVRDLQSDLGGRLKIYQSLLEANESEIVRFLTEAEHVVTTSKNDKLLHADRRSLLVALGEAAAARLSINPTMGEAYLIPRKGKVAFQPGYKGLVRLAYRSGEIDSIHVDVAYEGERYVRTGGTAPGIEHTPDDSFRTGEFENIIGAYAVVWLKGSSRPLFRAITKATLTGAAEASGDPRDKKYSDVWRSHPEAMCFKTALIRVANMLPRSDKFRDFHLVSQRATLREVNVEPPAIAGLEVLSERPALPAAPEREPLCSGKGAHIAIANAKHRDDYARLSGRPADDIWVSVVGRAGVPAIDGRAPTPEQLTITQGLAVRDRLKRGLERLRSEPDPLDDQTPIQGEIVDERQPGEDDPRDVEPPADWAGHNPAADDFAEGAGDR